MYIYPKKSDLLELQYNDVDITFGNDSVLTVNSLDNSDICISSSDDLGQQFYLYDQDGEVIGQYPTTKCNVYVAKAGYLPYLCKLYLMDKIQNLSFTENSRIQSPNLIEIGSDVDANTLEGSVFINNGHTSIKNSKGVKIKNDFKIAKGATLSIIP